MQLAPPIRTMVCASNSVPQNRVITAVALALTSLCFNVLAFPNYDSFGNQTAEGGSAYTVGADLGGQTNAPNYRWNSTGANFPPSKPVISSDNLAYAGLPASSGGSVAFTPTTYSDLIRGGGARLNLGIGSAGTAYYSLLLKITDLSMVPSHTTNNTFVAFCDDPAEQVAAIGRLGARLLAKKSGTGYVLGIGSNNTLADYRYDDSVFNINDVVLVVASYELAFGSSTNVNLWINPSGDSFGTDNPPSPDATAVISSGAGNINTQGPRALAILCQFGHAPSGIIDELRVGATWSQVTGGIGFSLAPTNQSVTVGANVTLTALAVGASPLTYTWQKDGFDLSSGSPYSGVNTRILTITDVSHAQAGNYTVAASNGTFGAVSTPATLTVSDPVLDPLITSHPASTTNLAGTTATFTVVAQGTEPLYYQWLKGENLLFDGDNISGVNTDTLTISSATEADAGGYKVSVINGLGSSVESDVASLVIVSPIAVSAEPTSRVVEEQGKTAVAVGISGTGPVTYQWYLNETLVSGAASAAYVITNADAGDVGNYYAIATGPANSVTSAVATVSLLLEPMRLAQTNLIAIRIGDGDQNLVESGNSMFLDQFTASGALQSTVSIPDSGPTAMVAIGPNLTTIPSSVTGSSLTRSLDGRKLVIAAYNTNLSYTASLQSSLSAAVPRGVGFIDSQGHYTLPVASTTEFSSTFWRGAVSDGVNNFWGVGRVGGTRYLGFDEPAIQIDGTWPNLRSIALYNGDIYLVTAVAGVNGVMRLEGRPTTGATPVRIVPSDSTGSSDCVVSQDGKLIYLADDRTIASGGGVQRWDYSDSSSAWALTYTLNTSLSAGVWYVAADFTGPTPVVYAVTRENENAQIVKFVDNGSGAPAVTIARSGARQTFRGIQMGPVETIAPPVLGYTRDGDNFILNWSGSSSLQSATDISGTFVDVNNAASPYTNVISGTRFFRLRQ